MTSSKGELSVFDYNVSTTDCQSAILQFSVPDGYLYLYERGTVKRSHSLLLLVKFTSDNLKMRLDFLDGPLEVLLESTKVKADLFHLLSLVFDSQSDGQSRDTLYKPKNWDLQIRQNSGIKVSWVRYQVTVHKGYIICLRDKTKTLELVIELWTDTHINQEGNALSLTNADNSYSFQGLPSTEYDNFIKCLETAKRHPKRLTEEDIKAVVLGNSDEEEDIEEEKETDKPDGAQDEVGRVQDSANSYAEDEVDGVNEPGGAKDELVGTKGGAKDSFQDVVDADAEAQAFLFLSFPWRRSKKPPRKPTEDEEFVMIELEEVLKHRAEVTEASNETTKPKHVEKDTSGTESAESEKNISGPDGEEIKKEGSPKKPISLLASSTVPPSPPSAPLGGGPAPPPPPPPPGALPSQPVGLKLKSVPTAKLKPVHWAKIPQARIDKSLWSKVDDRSENLDLKSLEKLFFLKENTKFSNTNRDSTSSTGSSASTGSKGLLLDFERAKTLGIVFKRPYERVLERLKDALCSIHELDVFKVEKLQQMKKLVPTADDRETYRLQEREKLIPADRFMYDLCGLQELGARIDLTLALLTLPADIKDSTQKVSELKIACKEVMSSISFREVVGYFRDIGNYLNAGRTGGIGVYGFQITSVDKLLEIKNADTGVTVFDWMIQQLKVKDSQLLNWASSLKHVHACCEIDMKAVEAYINNLKSTIKLQRDSVEHLQQLKWNSHEKKYLEDAKSCLAQQEVDVSSLREQFADATNSYKNTLEYLCEPSDRKSSEVFSSLSDLMRKFEIAMETK